MRVQLIIRRNYYFIQLQQFTIILGWLIKERIRLIYPENPILVGHELEKGTSNSSDGWFSRIKDMVRDHIASKRTFRSMENN